MANSQSQKIQWWRELPITVHVDTHPGCPPNYNLDSPMCGPGEDPSIEITDVTLNSISILEMLNANDIEALTAEMLAHFKQQSEEHEDD